MSANHTPASGVRLPCPFCGEDQASITLHLADGSFSCEECSADFSVADLEAIFARWQRVLSWVKQLPSDE